MADENLDNNPFYRALLSSHRKQFDIASKKCYIVAIPTSESIANMPINNYVINSHILMPSRLLKMHYLPIEGGTTDIEIDTDKLIINSKHEKASFVAKILREEIGYNSDNQQYRILITDRPLISGSSSSLVRKNSYELLGNNILGSGNGKNLSLHRHLNQNDSSNWTSKQTNDNNNNNKVVKLLNHDDAHKLLERISQSLTNDLEISVRTLQSTYLILPRFLDDASARVKSLVNLYTQKFFDKLTFMVKNSRGFLRRSTPYSNYDSILSSHLLSANSSFQGHGQFDDLIPIAIESYVVHLMHGRLIASIFQCYRLEDQRVYQKCLEISSFLPNLTICDLGAQKVFRDFKVTKNLLAEIARFDYLQSPLALVSSWTHIINLISDQLTQCVSTLNLSPLMTNSSSNRNSQVCICSDDLIASLVLTLATAAPCHMYSHIRYVELFSWSSSSKDQAAYCSATFQLVTNYLMNYVKDGSNSI